MSLHLVTMSLSYCSPYLAYFPFYQILASCTSIFILDHFIESTFLRCFTEVPLYIPNHYLLNERSAYLSTMSSLLCHMWSCIAILSPAVKLFQILPSNQTLLSCCCCNYFGLACRPCHHLRLLIYCSF